MPDAKRLRVLIIDDSMVACQMIKNAISSDPQIEVIGMAEDAYKACDMIQEMHPDVVTCDVNMPQINGIEFVRWLLPQYFVPVVMVSQVSTAVFEALEAGAVDFVQKPSVSEKSQYYFAQEVRLKIKLASSVKSIPVFNGINASEIVSSKSHTSLADRTKRIIAIGASTGGTEAITTLLSALPVDIPGIVIVQHIPPIFSKLFAERLNSRLPFRVKEAETGDYVESGTVLIAPGQQHMTVKAVNEKFRINCKEGMQVSGHCPSVDVLFDSIAKQAKENAVGIILTGMGADGAVGLLQIRRSGGRTIGQDEQSSVIYGMPKVAYNIKAVEIQASLDKIPQVLFDMLDQ